MASRKGGIPDTGVYLVSPRSIAAIAAFLMLSGVSKSGSPVDSETISRPAFLRSRAFCVTAIVAEGFTRKRASARKDIWPRSGAGNDGARANAEPPFGRGPYV